jgi:uncharacterized membrane protein
LLKVAPKIKLIFPVIENSIWIEPLLEGHLTYKATISLSQRWLLIQVWLYIENVISDLHSNSKIIFIQVHCIYEISNINFYSE